MSKYKQLCIELFVNSTPSIYINFLYLVNYGISISLPFILFILYSFYFSVFIAINKLKGPFCMNNRKSKIVFKDQCSEFDEIVSVDSPEECRNLKEIVSTNVHKDRMLIFIDDEIYQKILDSINDSMNESKFRCNCINDGINNNTTSINSMNYSTKTITNNINSINDIYTLGTRTYHLITHHPQCTLTIQQALPLKLLFTQRTLFIQITGIVVHPYTKICDISNKNKHVIVTYKDIGLDKSIYTTRTLSGLINLGNTCYMNASLQALLNCKVFYDFFFLCINFDENKLSKQVSCLVNQNTNKELKMFKDVLGNKVKGYSGKGEQDAMEFITDLLDILHEELKILKVMDNVVLDKGMEGKNGIKKGDNNTNDNTCISNTNIINYTNITTTNNINEWEIKNKSIITDLFFQQVKTSICCTECPYKRSIMEPVLALSCPVPKGDTQKYFENIVLFYLNMNKVPMKVFGKENFSIRELKIFMKEEYEVINDLFICTYKYGIQYKVEEDIILKNIKGMLYCYEYKKEDIQHYYWIRISWKGYLWMNHLDFYILGILDTGIINKDKVLLNNNNIIPTRNSDTISSNIPSSSDINTTILSPTNLNNIYEIVEKRFIPFIHPDHYTTFRFLLRKVFTLEYSNSNTSCKNIMKINMVKLITSYKYYHTLFDKNNPIEMMVRLIPERININYCINKYLEDEYIFGVDKYMCDGCGVYTVQYKKTELYKTSKYMIIQLKRFTYQGVLKKINTYIDIPDIIYINKMKYRVISMINHIAPSTKKYIGQSEGHYTSYVYYKEAWWLCNDSMIYKTDGVKNDDVYIVILEKL